VAPCACATLPTGHIVDAFGSMIRAGWARRCAPCLRDFLNAMPVPGANVDVCRPMPVRDYAFGSLKAQLKRLRVSIQPKVVSEPSRRKLSSRRKRKVPSHQNRREEERRRFHALTRGTRGSVRLDVVEGPLDAPTCCYDLKTGSATLTPGRIRQFQGNLPGGANVPVIQIKPP
jgi:hypothetical protein